MKSLYIDCAMGCAGDMLTAALLELHPAPEDFLRRMNAVFCNKLQISAAPDSKCGIAGTHVTVLVDGDEEGETERHSHKHTSVREIMSFIDGVSLPEKVREDAKSVYSIIAEAESRVHGLPVENVHFHELGSLDALADVLSVCELLYELAPELVLASPVNVGSGFVRCAHGVLPVPAPATELILRGVPTYSGEIKSELCTPTGAALLRRFVTKFGPMPQLCIGKIGYGMGTKDFEAVNCVRAMLGRSDAQPEQIVELCCNLDDMTPEDVGFAMERLFDAGALDVWTAPIGMKKNRPAVLLTCMCREETREAILETLFRHTTTLGVRASRCDRYTLTRAARTVDTAHGPVRVKSAEGFGVKREKAEFDDLARIARETGRSLREVRAEI